MRTDSLQQFVNLRRQLSQEREQLSGRLGLLNKALGQLSGSDSTQTDGGHIGGGFAAARSSRKRRMSAAARARIADAQRKRWAAARGKSGATRAAAPKASSSGKRQFSAAARRRIAEAARRRWAAAKRAGKNRL